ncbi:MAG: FAD-binding oxidoreductase [Myxococcales bacterium]|nr:FAD-binding oxidoreductase [Myxococcales bacterium]
MPATHEDLHPGSEAALSLVAPAPWSRPSAPGALPIRERAELAIERYALRARQARVGARVLSHVVRGLVEPLIHTNRDFGNLRDKGEQTSRRVADADEARALLTAAYASGTPVNVGAGLHSSNGHTLSRGGLRLLLDGATWGAPRMLPGDLVEVPAPMRWGDLEAFLRRHGRASPVLTDHLHTTVGGTLSVGGGIGTRSLVGGRQLDQIERAHFILPNGETRSASATENVDLFRYGLGSQGVLGIVDRVVMRTAPRRPFVAQFRVQWRTLSEAARAADRFVRACDDPSFAFLDIVGPILDSSVVELTLGFEFATRREAHALLRAPPAALAPLAPRIFTRRVVKDLANANHARSAPYIAMLTAPRDPHVFLWNDFFFPSYRTYARFLRHFETQAAPRVGNRYLMAALGLAYATFPERPTFPIAGLVREPGQRPFSIGFNYAVPHGDPEGQAAIRRLLDELQRVAVDMGGRLYRYGYSDADAAELRRIYGDDYDRLLALRAEVDPRGLFNPDVLR